MLSQLPTLQKLIRQLQRLPYLASKNVYKVAVFLLQSDEKNISQLIRLIEQSRQQIKQCVDCYSWVENGDRCTICSSSKRDKSVLCIVETWHDLCVVENSGEYSGLYHVLGGVLCPLEGIGPENLRINELFARISFDTKELIFALNPTPEGEATASYIMTHSPQQALKVSKLARGMPVGSMLEYMDRVTICKALLDRRPF